ncbi:hypothetical protein H4R33_005013 [Dimargaris cristalligena]|uniref:Sulfate transporter family-domain-containing protein n=1 Tax=Dimargaris cristalligena TaxID=215637 RepID=A0A4V1J4V4_9FUNG|nr:hypothetical protein H4R33_005013 [Dimargaris cristalligena]RKP36869.1 sulfate transporter family-domain-containing protein [Dimargaris cristalligena]|eukprot:RKP36869.1 sulfate transporter family-domain-containing protein [Dimargaris cristalligena]
MANQPTTSSLLSRRSSLHQVSFSPLPQGTGDRDEGHYRYPLTPGFRTTPILEPNQEDDEPNEEQPCLSTPGTVEEGDPSGPSRDKSTIARFATRLRYYVPIFGWLPEYSWSYLQNDLRAGLTVSCLLIPQALSYGSLAKLNPINGLYTALIPNFIYGIFGTSRHLAMGPEALISTLVGTIVADYQQTVNHQANGEGLLDSQGIARILCFLVGAITFAVGIFRLGFLDSILSKALLRGFVTAVAFVIICGQMIPLCGLDRIPSNLPTHASPIDRVKFVVQHFSQHHSLTLWVSVGCIAFLVLSTLVKRRFKRVNWLQQIPEILVTVLASTILCYIFDWHRQGLAIFGNVDAAFPMPALPQLPEPIFYKDIITSSMLVSIIGIVESIIIAREYASKNHYSVSPNRELVALGMANMVGCVFGSFPAFGSLARSRLNDRAKARTQLSGIISGAIVLLTIVLLLPFFHYLPKTVLSAIIFNTALSLLTKTPRELKFLYQVGAWGDIVLLSLIFGATMVVSVEVGILLAVTLSLMKVIKRTTIPRITILGRVTGTKDQFAPVPDFPDTVEHVEGIMMVRIEEPLFFANTGQLQARLKRLELFGDLTVHPSEQARLAPAQAVVFDVENMPDVDASALAILKEIVESYHLRKVVVCFVQLHPQLYVAFDRSGLTAKIGPQMFFPQVTNALHYIEQTRSFGSVTSADLQGDTDSEFAPY